MALEFLANQQPSVATTGLSSTKPRESLALPLCKPKDKVQEHDNEFCLAMQADGPSALRHL
jgi:hypothetical protein